MSRKKPRHHPDDEIIELSLLSDQAPWNHINPLDHLNPFNTQLDELLGPEDADDDHEVDESEEP